MRKSKRGRIALLVLAMALSVALLAVTIAVRMKVLPGFGSGYKSVGMIEVNPHISAELGDRIMPLWEGYACTIVQNLHSERLLREAMKSPEWKKYRNGPPEVYLAEWNKNLVVRLVPNSFDVTVTYTDHHPDGGEVAPIAVRSLIHAFKEICGTELIRELTEKRMREESQAQIFDQEISACEDRIGQLIQTDSEDLQKVFDEKFAKCAEVERQLNQLKADLLKKRSALAKANGGGALAADDLKIETSAVEHAQELRGQMKGELSDLSDRTRKLGIQRAERLRLDEERRRVRTKIEDLSQEIDLAQSMRIIDPGGPAERVAGRIVPWGR